MDSQNLFGWRYRIFCTILIVGFGMVFNENLSGQDMSARLGGIGGSLIVKGKGAVPETIQVKLLRSDRSPFWRVFTDSAGSFEFRGIPTGHYYIVIDHPNYRRLEISVEVVRGLVQRRILYLEPRLPATPSGGVISSERYLVSRQAKKLLEKGENELRKAHYPEAGEFFDRALAIEPRFAEAHSGRGLIYLQQNDLEHAQEQFESAIALSPNLAQALFGLGAVLSRLRDNEAAIQYFNRGLSIDPSSYVALLERGRCFYELREFEPAEADCIRARKILVRPRPALNVLLGNIYMGEGRTSEALREFMDFLRLDAHNPIAPQVQALVKKLCDSGVTPAR